MQNWQNVIWQEWRYTSDLEFAEHLFETVADRPVGWGSRLSIWILGIISGASLGVLVVLPITFRWSMLQYLALVGGVAGAARAYILGQTLLWRDWIRRLEANTPTVSLGRVLFGVLLLACIGGMVFGPFFWIMMVGLFWAIGGVIVWINSGTDDVNSFTPEDRYWWFWWRKRPTLVQLQAALEYAGNESPTAAEIWANPLRRLAEKQRRPVSPEKLINSLSSSDWVERFIARHTLVSLGPEAAYALQNLATAQHQTPLQATAKWLLANINQSK